MGPDGLPDTFFNPKLMDETKAYIIDDLETRTDLINMHLESRIILLNKSLAQFPRYKTSDRLQSKIPFRK